MLEIRHIELSEANAYVTENHRHHKAVCGHRFSLACYADGRLCGVAIVGRPRSRRIDQYTTVEVLRLCTDGTKMPAPSYTEPAAGRQRHWVIIG